MQAMRLGMVEELVGTHSGWPLGRVYPAACGVSCVTRDSSE